MGQFDWLRPLAWLVRRTWHPMARLRTARRVAQRPHIAPKDHADELCKDVLRLLGVQYRDDSKRMALVHRLLNRIVTPAYMRKPYIVDWLSKTNVQKDLKYIAFTPISGSPSNTEAYRQLVASCMDASGENETRAESVVERVIAFIEAYLRSSPNDAVVAAYVREGFGSLHHRFDESQPNEFTKIPGETPEPIQRREEIDVGEIKLAFGEASRVLLGWPQETDGHWIDRPELIELADVARQEKPTVTVLLGQPGVGKSAVLARLGSQLRERADNILLAIKADGVPQEANTLDDINNWVGCDVVAAVGQLAQQYRVVVLIDQLDALADLMVRHSGRLSALLRLVSAMRNTENVQILLSCREFEFHNDVRLSTLEANSITLAAPPWEDVLPVLGARGLPVDELSDEQKEVLRIPRHLSVFVEHSSAKEPVPVFSTYQALLDHVIRKLGREFGRRTVEAAERLAVTMAQDEELWVARSRFDPGYGAELDNLVAFGLLVQSDTGISVAFRHQTTFDFLRARAFLQDGVGLADYVLKEKQESLFVRPVLWSTLEYLRASDSAIYRREFGRLWEFEGLRAHLRILLATFLGQRTDPDEVEIAWLMPKLDDSALQHRILWSMAGSPGWFLAMKPRLDGLMIESPSSASRMVVMLIRGLEFAREDVLSLLESNWRGRAGYCPPALSVLSAVEDWDDRCIELAERIAEQAARELTGDTFPVFQLLERIGKCDPDLEPIVLFRYLKTRFMYAKSHSSDSKGGFSKGVENALSRGERLRDIGRVADRAPRAFVVHGWPWLVEVLETLVQDPPVCVDEYQRCSMHFELFERTDSIGSVFEKAIALFAEARPSEFRCFVAENQGLELVEVHRLLAIGLRRLASRYPEVVVDYLLEDKRRLVIGDFKSEHRESVALISSVVPHLDDQSALRLEQGILTWERYRKLGDDAEVRFNRKKWSRSHRLRLLRSFPKDRLSREGRRLLEEEERAFPHTENHDFKIGELTKVVSPMSSEEMQKASDEDILGLFSNLTDDRADHPDPERWLSGGSIEASRAFGEFAKAAPDRALRILDRFQAGSQERPAGSALAELGNSDVPTDVLKDRVRELDARGFSSDSFRCDAATCLKDVARRDAGLDEPTCERLERWIVEGSAAIRTVGPVEDGLSQHAERDEHSLLWGYGGGMILPHGNYPALEALSMGYLCRKPMDADGWLPILERHVFRSEETRVWVAIAQYFRYLGHCDRDRSLKFIENLFLQHPDVLLDSRTVRFLYPILGWISPSLLDQIVDQWVSSDWPLGCQAAGEVVMVPRCRDPYDTDAVARVERVIEKVGIDEKAAVSLRVGMAHTLVTAARNAEMRAVAMALLVELIAFEDKRLSVVLSNAFHDDEFLIADSHSRCILRACLDHPLMLSGPHGEGLARRLQALLSQGWDADLVCAIAQSLLESQLEKRGPDRVVPAFMSGDLVDLALTLHRIQTTRVAGLELFERLMELRAYKADESLQTLDRHAQ